MQSEVSLHNNSMFTLPFDPNKHHEVVTNFTTIMLGQLLPLRYSLLSTHATEPQSIS
uniref:Uncharacterized protein n=1 Tax=Rhizophora mucronata TaxID=61149 RepID=A0A2P2Q6E8_RHIMU